MAALSGETTAPPEESCDLAGWGTHGSRHRVIRDREREWCWAARPLVLCRKIGGAEPHDRVGLKARRAIGPMDASMRQALVERADLIESRAVLDHALLVEEPWTRALRSAPRGLDAAAWHQNGCTVAAYPERYGRKYRSSR